jgi:hypothetical protein
MVSNSELPTAEELSALGHPKRSKRFKLLVAVPTCTADSFRAQNRIVCIIIDPSCKCNAKHPLSRRDSRVKDPDSPAGVLLAQSSSHASPLRRTHACPEVSLLPPPPQRSALIEQGGQSSFFEFSLSVQSVKWSSTLSASPVFHLESMASSAKTRL